MRVVRLASVYDQLPFTPLVSGLLICSSLHQVIMSLQHPLTIITPVEPSKKDQLTALLNNIQNPDVENNPLVPFTKIESVHFVRFVLMEAVTKEGQSQLVFSSDFDGEEGQYISELIRVAEPGLRQLYSCCTGFADNLELYWQQHKVPTITFYNGHPGIPAKQVRYEEDLRTAITGYLTQENKNGDLKTLSAVQIKEKVFHFLKAKGILNTSGTYLVRTPFARFVFQRKKLIITTAGVAAGLFTIGYLFVRLWQALKIPVGFAALGLAALVGGGVYTLKKKLNKLEASDPAEFTQPPSGDVIKLMQAENHLVQNQLTHLVEVKDGTFRLRLLQAVLRAINFLARTVHNKGSLGSIPSIHFARWVIIDENKRLLFFSNYDGSWESYLGDFVDKAASGLTAIWSNTKNFPRSHNLVKQGARDEQRFKEWARGLQIPTQVWYSAYKTLSVQNINNNSFIHAGLYQHMNEAEAQVWLDRLFVSLK